MSIFRKAILSITCAISIFNSPIKCNPTDFKPNIITCSNVGAYEPILQADVGKMEYIYDNEIKLLALMAMAEAEGECEHGKRLVIDTILNRVDSDEFPDTIEEVVYQPNQFTSVWNGRVERCYPTDEVCRLAFEEFNKRKNNEVIFFTAGKYGNYGTPMFNVENHYFSSI